MTRGKKKDPRREGSRRKHSELTFVPFFLWFLSFVVDTLPHQHHHLHPPQDDSSRYPKRYRDSNARRKGKLFPLCPFKQLSLSSSARRRPPASTSADRPSFLLFVLFLLRLLPPVGCPQYTFATLPSRDPTLDLLLALWRSQAPEAYASFLASQPEDGPSSSSSLSPNRNSASRRLSISSNSVPLLNNDGTAVGGGGVSSSSFNSKRDRSDSSPAAASAVTGVTGNKAGHLNGVKEDSASHEATKAETKAFPEKCLDVR